MTLDMKQRFVRYPSLGVDAVDLNRYSAIDTDDGEMIIYDEECENGWIQCNFWIARNSME